MSKSLRLLIVLVLLLVLFRGVIFRTLIRYVEVNTRPTIEITNEKVLDIIEKRVSNKTMDLDAIANVAREITNEYLSFKLKAKTKDPNQLLNFNEANCVGYSALYNSIVHELIKQNSLHKEVRATHKVARLEFLGINIHSFFNSRYFRDHDYNEITNTKTGEVLVIDPSISDYLGIHYVRSSK